MKSFRSDYANQLITFLFVIRMALFEVESRSAFGDASMIHVTQDAYYTMCANL